MDGLGEALGLIATITGMLPGPDDRAGWAAAAQEGLDRAAQLVSEPDGVVRPWRVTHVDAAVEQLVVQRAVLPPSGVLDVFVEVVQSAQQGALYLNFGGPSLDASIGIEIGGPDGVEPVSFLSSTSLETVALAIRQVGAFTGSRRLLIQRA